MDLPDSRELLLIGINVLVVLVVVFHLHQEMSSFLNFVSRTSGDRNYRVTRVYRASSRWAFGLSILTAAFTVAVKYLYDIQPLALLSFGALLVGFFVSGMIYQVCFVNETGLGAVSPRFEMEIQWNEIAHYEWKDNWLILRLKRRTFPRRKIRFHDSEAILAVNERLKAQVESPDTRASQPSN